MKKHPSAFKLCGELAEKVKTVKDTPLTLYEGRVQRSIVCVSSLEGRCYHVLSFFFLVHCCWGLI